MKLNHLLSIVVCLFVTVIVLLPQTITGQTIIPIEGRAKVIAFDAPYNKIKIDMLEDQNEFIQEFNLLPTTKITDSKGKPYAPEKIKPGTEIKMVAQKVGYVRQVNEIKVTFSFVGDGLKIAGVLEKYVPANDYAVIKGERVKLSPGVPIKGGSRISGNFKSFSELTVGNKMEIEGSRKEDKFIYASKAVVKENDFTSDDKAMMNVMGLQFSSAHLDSVKLPDNLMKQSNGAKTAPTGYVSFGDAQYKLDSSLYLQMYVNNLGNKILPHYIKDIPDGEPEKLNFRFFVIDNPLFNAFSLPNGLVFINSGLLGQLDNEAQLAAILGHEITHVVYKHAKERYNDQKQLKNAIEAYYAGKELKNLFNKVGNNGTVNANPNAYKPSSESVDIAVMLLYSGLQGNFKPVVEEAATLLPVIDKIPPESKKAVMGLLYGLRGIASNDHNRDNEDDADCVGLYYMQEAGYDPREAAKVWEKFSTMTLNSGNMMAKLNQTAREWVTTSNMYSYKNPINQAGDMIVNKIITAATDNWFSSYPKASARYRNLNQLVASYYSGDDLTKTIVGESEYMEVKRRVAQVTSGIKK